jgi:hypothetical protein
LAAILAIVALSIGHAGAASARGSGGHGEETFDGRYVLLHADPSVGPDIDVLRARHRTYELVLPSGSRPKPGAAVRVTGRLTGKTGQGGPVIAVSRVESPPPDVKRATPRLATSGDVRVLVVLAQWTGPDGVTPDSARQQILGDDAAWLHEASYGGVTLSGDVTGWLAIGTPAAACDYADIDQRAEQAALVAGFDAARYDRVVIYFPHQNCGGTAGWGMIGGPVSWLNGYLDRRVSVHELGHTFGLNHAHLLRCVQGSVEVTLAASGCESVEYGDPFDAMGSSSYVGHFSAAQKDQLGWLGSGVGVANLASYPTVT